MSKPDGRQVYGPIGPVRMRFKGRWAVLERVPIEDLEEWREARGLVAVGRVAYGLGHNWPPMILYERTADAQDSRIGGGDEVL